MKRIQLILLFFCVTINSFSQIAIGGYAGNLVAPASLNDLWNFSIVNSGSQSTFCNIEMNVISSNKKLLLTARTEKIAINRGLTLITYSNVSPISYSFSSNEESSQIQMSNALMPGDYTICLKLFSTSEGIYTSENCFNVVLINNSYFSLIDPFDKETIDALDPLLTWTPLLEDGIEYRVFLSPVEKNQSSKQALLHNPIYLDGEKAMQPLLYYPSFAPALERGRSYVWYVKAYKNDKQVAVSQIWEFKLSEKYLPPPAKECYRVITSGLNSGFYISGHILKFAYDNRNNKEQLTCQFKNVIGKDRMNIPVMVKLSPGINKIDIDLSKIKGINKNNYYTVNLNDQNTKYTLSFYYSKSEKHK